MMSRKGWALLLPAVATGCGQIPEGVHAVRGFDADRYLGQWYEVARLENRLERAKFSGPDDVAMLEVPFFGPFYGGYDVVDLDPAYSQARVVGANWRRRTRRPAAASERRLHMVVPAHACRRKIGECPLFSIFR